MKAYCILGSLLILGACSWLTTDKPMEQAIACKVIEGNPAAQDVLAATALQRQTETSPLYTTPASQGALIACRVRHQAEGVLVLEYQFKNDAWLHIKRDPRIEYTEQNARFLLPAQQAIPLLAKAEQSAFGPKGCGIDWSQSEIKTSDTDAGGTETIYRGSVCNCQARIRRNTGGSVVGFKLARTC